MSETKKTFTVECDNCGEYFQGKYEKGICSPCDDEISEAKDKKFYEMRREECFQALFQVMTTIMVLQDAKISIPEFPCSAVSWIIMGSAGLPDEIKKRCDEFLKVAGPIAQVALDAAARARSD